MSTLRARVLGTTLLVVLLVAPTVVSGQGGPDAGTGLDAGDSLSTALALAAPGSFVGSATERDEDWYRLDANAATPRCVSVRVDSSMRGHAGLTLSGPDRTRQLRMPLREGDAFLGIATPSPQQALVQIRRNGAGDDLQTYDANVQVIGVPDATSGDASTLRDTGAVPGTSLEAPRGCFTGTVGDRLLGDAVDLYRVVALSADEPVYYSIAGEGLTAVLVDGAGNAVGPEIASGGLAGVMPPAPGDYFLRTSTTSMASAPYVAALSVGPPDPGSGCRPMCIL